ncbi:MAG TPA: hypothetical protein VJQ49_07715 [Casimicrobiaceae bacterium]|nr:hypothetical protein [Casimicrobiaceae bacterium]
MKYFHKLFPAGHLIISALFVLSAAVLLAFAAFDLWKVVAPGEGSLDARLGSVLDAIALLTIAVASLQLGQTIVEEEVQREAHMSAPTRVRRFLSRFMVVLVVALTIEALVAVFHYSREDPSRLPYAASVGLMAAALLAAWAVFVRLNISAETLEPEAMHEAKKEDARINRDRAKAGA